MQDMEQISIFLKQGFILMFCLLQNFVQLFQEYTKPNAHILLFSPNLKLI